MPYPVPPPPPPPLVAAPLSEDIHPSAPASSQGQQASSDRAASTSPSLLSSPERFPVEPLDQMGGSFLLAQQSTQEASLLGPPLQVDQPVTFDATHFGVSTLDLDLEVGRAADRDITIHLQQSPPAPQPATTAAEASYGATGEATSVAGTGDRPTAAHQVTVEADPQVDPNLVHQVRSFADEASPEVTGLVESSRTLMVELFRAVETGQIETQSPGSRAGETDIAQDGTLQDDSPPPGPSETEAPSSEPDAPEIDTPEIDAPEIDAPEIDAPEIDTPEIDELEVNPPADEPAAPAPSPPSPALPDAEAPPVTDASDALEVTADRQVYDRERQSFLAEGDVVVTFRQAVLQANRVQVNIPNRIAVAEGDVVFVRGEQVLRGDRIEYNLIRQDGTVLNARGEVFIPQAGTDLDTQEPVVPEDVDPLTPEVPLSEQLARDQPPVETATTTGELTIGVGIASGPGSDIDAGTTVGTVRQLRFEADQIDFRPGGWEATGVRVTNDPFSPPELEIRSNRAVFTRLSDTRSELVLRNPRLVFDQRVSIPLLRERYIFDQRQRDPLPFQFGFDEEERGGFFIQTTFEPIVTPNVQFTVIPQIFLQRAIEGGESDEPVPIGEEPDREGFFAPENYGVIANLDIEFDSRTNLEGNVTLTSFDLEETDEELRGSVRLRRQVLGNHQVTTEFSYRDRLFNGTLGFQTVQRTYGVVFSSPVVTLGDTGIELTYQAGIQRINATITEDRRDDLLPPIGERENLRATLTRYQVAAEASRLQFLWIGRPLPATPDEGLRYTPAPVVPYVALLPRIRGVAGFYSSGDTQPVLTGQLSLLGQFGHFSRPFFDYLGFNLSYRRSTDGSESPFDFDRVADREVFSAGATVQLIGPIRIGFRTSISLDNDEGFDTSYILEYSRRTYGVVASYNPDREIGTLSFRLSDFAWTGTPEPFDGAETAPTVPATDDPAIEDPTLEDAEDATVEDSAEDPAIEDPAIEDPAIEDLEIEDPTLEDPEAGPTLEDPEAGPAIEDLEIEDPAIEDPASENSDREDPVLETPATEDTDASMENIEAPAPGDPIIEDLLEDSPADPATESVASPVSPAAENRAIASPESPAVEIPVIPPITTPSPAASPPPPQPSATPFPSPDHSAHPAAAPSPLISPFLGVDHSGLPTLPAPPESP